VGLKSKGNYKIEFCIKTDCTNRDRVSYPSCKSVCDKCIRYNLYMTNLKSKEELL